MLRAASVGRPRANNTGPARTRAASQPNNDGKPDVWQGPYRTLGDKDPGGWDRSFYEIQEVLAYRTSRGNDQYLVAWSDLPQLAQAREPVEHLTPDPNWAELLEAYEEEKQRKNKVNHISYYHPRVCLGEFPVVIR